MGMGSNGRGRAVKKEIKLKKKKKYIRKLSGVMNVLITLILMFISWVHIYIKAY